MVQIVHRQYVMPFEVILETNQLLREKFATRSWTIALSPEQRLVPEKNIMEIYEYVHSFQTMIKSTGVRIRQAGYEEKDQ